MNSSSLQTAVPTVCSPDSTNCGGRNSQPQLRVGTGNTLDVRDGMQYIDGATPEWLQGHINTTLYYVQTYGWYGVGAAVVGAYVWNRVGETVKKSLGLAPRFQTDATYRAELEARRRQMYEQKQEELLQAATNAPPPSTATTTTTPAPPPATTTASSYSSSSRRRGGGGGMDRFRGGSSYRPSRPVKRGG